VSRLLLAFVLALAVAAAAAAAPRVATSYSFGRTGGNIRPFVIAIAADGSVHVSGPVRVLRQTLTAQQTAGLAALLRRERFSTLPATTRCTGTLPDIASEVVTVKAGTRLKSALVHGGCSPRFTAVYTALAAAVGLRYESG
jgi:hypothetical protein